MSEKIMSDEEYARGLADDLKEMSGNVPLGTSPEVRRILRSANALPEGQRDDHFLDLARNMIAASRTLYGDAAFDELKKIVGQAVAEG